MKKVLLLNPPRYNGIPVFRLFRAEYVFTKDEIFPPMDLAYFSSALKKEKVKVKLIDANGENLNNRETLSRIEEFSPDIIVVKGVLNILAHDLIITKKYKEINPQVKIVLACRSCMNIEEEVFRNFPFVDGIARGEIDAFAKDIVVESNLDKIDGMVTKNKKDNKIRIMEDLDENPIPDLHSLPNIWYSHYNFSSYCVPSGYSFWASRGCPYSCSFCMSGSYYIDGGVKKKAFRFRKRNPDNVIEEIRILKEKFKIRDIYFCDEIFTIPGHADFISKKLIDEKINISWVCEGKVDLVNKEMLYLMKKSGCKAIFYGVESGDDKILTDIKKGQTVDDIKKALTLTKKVGIKTGAYIVLGFPKERWYSFLNTLKLFYKISPDMIKFCFFVPYPVTEIFEIMKDRGLISSYEWGKFDRHISNMNRITIRTEKLNAYELSIMEIVFKKLFHKQLK